MEEPYLPTAVYVAVVIRVYHSLRMSLGSGCSDREELSGLFGLGFSFMRMPW